MTGRIPQDFIDDLLHRTDIVDIVEERLPLKRTGRNYSGLCPFHQEKSPSFSVNPEKQFFYCFGCGAGGNAIGFVMEYDRLEFREAVETLAKRQGLEIPNQGNDYSQQDKERQQSYQLLEQADQFYQEQLRQHPERDKAVSYLKQRGLSGAIAKQFGIGFAPPGWDNLIKQIGDQYQPALDKAGLVIHNEEKQSYYDRFRDRIIFPIVDMRGRTIAFGGRVLTDEKPKYLNSPETHTFKKHEELYGLYQARKSNRDLQRVVIVEGYMDVVALAQFGISNTVATLGTATTSQHLQRLFKLVPEVVFCFDGDNAGRKAAGRALENALPLMEDGRQARFLFLPEGEDPDTMVREEGTEAFNQRIEQAQPLSSFLFDSLSEGINLDSGEGRARLSALAMPEIDKIPGQVFKQLMRQQLSEISGLEQQFFSQIQETQTPPEPDYHQDYQPNYFDSGYDQPVGPAADAGYNSRKQAIKPRQPTPKTTGACTRALKLLLHTPKLALQVDLETSDALGALQDPQLGLLKALVEQLRNDPNLPTALLLLQWRDSPFGQQLQQLAGEELLIPKEEQVKREFIDCLHQLVKRGEQAELDRLTHKTTPLTSEEKKRLLELLQHQQKRNRQERTD